MLLLGIDLGTSSIKVSVVDAANARVVSTASYPDKETEILVPQSGWAEQSPDLWWENIKKAILRCHHNGNYHPKDISAIGIAYQMHGLVIVDADQKVLRNSIIWCDSRAVEIGNDAFQKLGEENILPKTLNSPGNFTASKLAWVKQNEVDTYQKISKMMLPGDFVSMKFTGEITTNPSSLSEGILWDFKADELSKDVMNFFGFDDGLIPEVKPVFSDYGSVKPDVADELGLTSGIPITYKAGDQPNNALALNVSAPGEVAATAGTSGVIYGVTDQLAYDKENRVNTFAHVSHTQQQPRFGVLLCINGTGSMNRWAKNTFANHLNYEQANELAAGVNPGSEGLIALPFGNGAERMLQNKIIGAGFHHIDLNVHQTPHFLRAAQEGIAFSFRYGLDILKENGMRPNIIRAGKANLFLSKIFAQTFVNICGVSVELFESDGSFGAAIGAGIGVGCYQSANEAFAYKKPLSIIEPTNHDLETAYEQWKSILNQNI